MNTALPQERVYMKRNKKELLKFWNSFKNHKVQLMSEEAEEYYWEEIKILAEEMQNLILKSRETRRKIEEDMILLDSIKAG